MIDAWTISSVYSSYMLVSESVSLRIAVSLPSRVAANAIFCDDCGREPTQVNICERVSESLTGLRIILAAMAVISTCVQVRRAEPNAPPTNGEITRTFS